MDKMQLVMKLESVPDEEASSHGATREGLSSAQVGSGRVTELLDLSKQLRNILLMRPIMQLEMNKLRIGGDESEDKGLFQGVDTHYLVLSVLDFMMEGTTINMGCTQDEVLGHLAAVSREMKPELTRQQAARVAEVVLDVLDNKAENFREFAYEYFCALERRPKLFRFRLVVYEPDLEDIYRYRPTPEGYLVYLGMLDLSPEDSQELMEKMLDMLISRGRFEAALEIAHQARKRFLEYRQLIRERLLQAYRAPGSVNWTREMVGKLNAARSDISSRQSEGQRMEESVRQSMQKANEWKTRQDIERLLKMLESAGLMRTRLVQDITVAPEKYLEAQRAVFRARRPSGLPDLEPRVFPQLLNLPTARLAEASDHVISGLYPPQWPKVYDLKDEANCRLTQQQVAEAAELRARGLADAEVVLSILRLKRLHGCAQEARNQANSQLTNLKEKQVHLRAARAQTEIDLTNQQLQALEERARLEAEQLVPWREKATEEGSKFWAALSLRADQFRQEAKEVKSAEQSAEAKRQALEQEARELRGREDTLKAERVRLDLEEESFQQEHQTLLNDGQVGEEEATLAAVERWSRQATTHQETAKQADTDAGILREDEARYRQTRRQEDEALRRLQTELSQKQSLVATGEAEREALGQLAILRQASESEVADPDAPGLPAAVQHIIESQRQDLDRLTIRLNELEERQKDIRETGVAGNSKDVAKVVSRLAEMGIRSAIPFNEYISKAIPDAEQARSVVTSNPARFMGVCIADSELAKARGIDAYLPELRAPVMVSTATLDPDPLPDNAFVLPASDDAWFNREAAQRLLAALEQTIDEERERRSQWLVRLGDAEFTAQRLASYLERYGNFRLATMRREAEQLALEADATKARSEEAEQKADACRELAENKKALAHQERSAAQDAERHAQTLRRFFEKHEANHPYRIERLRALELDLATVSNRQRLITEENEQLEIQLRNLRGRHNEIEALLRDTVREKEAIRHYDETSPVPDYGKLSDTELIFLRDNYRTAADTLDTNERERLGVLAYQLEQTRRDLGQKQEAFSRQFAELKREDFEAYLDEDFERCLANLEKEVEESGQTLLAKERALAVADSQLKQYTREHKPAYQPTEEMHELSDNALDTRIAEAQEGHRTATNEAEVAHGAAAEARQRQERAEASSVRLKRTP